MGDIDNLYLVGYISPLYLVGDIMEHLIFTVSQLSSILKNRRKELGFTQKFAADRVGLLPKTVSALENDPEKCSVESLMKYAASLEFQIVVKPKENTAELKTEW